MSSDLTRADRLVNRLTTSLAAACPKGWRFKDAAEGVAASTGIVVYYEQGAVSNEYRNDPLPVGYVGVSFLLTITAPNQDAVKGTRAVTAALLDLIPALDSLDDLYWGPTAEIEQLESGEVFYRIPTLFLSTIAKE